MTSLRRFVLGVLALGTLAAAPAVAQGEARTAPKPVTTPKPEYPTSLVDTGLEGTAVIAFTVDVDGSAKEATVKSADHPAFGEAALAVLPQWKFTPGTKNGAPSPTKVNLPFNFVAPADQKINAIFRRKVFREVTEEPVAGESFSGSLAPLTQPPVRYPPTKAGTGQVETVEVAFLIGPDGLPVNPTVLGEVPAEFAASAIMHVAALVFERPMVDGKPVYVSTTRKVRVAEQ